MGHKLVPIIIRHVDATDREEVVLEGESVQA